MQTERVNLRIGDQTYGVETNAPEVLSYFRRAYAACLEPREAIKATCFTLAREARNWIVYANDVEIARAPLRKAIWLLEWHMIRRAVMEDTNCAVFHAAWVACGAQVVMLAGEGGTGKSRLCLELLGRGFRYGAEDMAFLQDGCLVPFAHAIQLRRDDALLQNVDADRQFGGYDGRMCVEISPSEVASPTPLAKLAIVVLDARAGPLRPLDGLSGLQHLLALSYRLDRITQPTFDRLTAVAAAGSIVTGRADADTICTLLDTV